MTPTTPIIIEGKTFDLLSINLSVNGTYSPGKTPDCSVCVRLVPTRETEDGTMEMAPDNAIPFVLGSMVGADADTVAAFNAILQTLQTWVTAKGI